MAEVAEAPPTAPPPAAPAPRPAAPAAEGEEPGLLASLPRTFEEVEAANAAARAPKAAEPPKKKPEPEPEPEPEKREEKTPSLPDPEPEPFTPATPPKDDEIPPNLNERAKADWKGLKEARRKAEDENATLKKKIAELEAVANPEEIKALRTQLADYEERLMATNLERHPQFQKYFNERQSALMDVAKSIGGENIAAILQMPDNEYRNNLLAEEFSNLNPVAQARLGAVMNEIEGLKAQKERELAGASSRWKALQEQQQLQQKAQSEANIGVFTSVLDRWSDPKTGIGALQTRDGDGTWNSAVEKRKSLAREIFSGNQSVEELARASIWAALAPELVAQLKGAKKLEAELREEISQLKAAKPTVEGGVADEEEADANLGFIEAVNKNYRRAGGR